ncbi:GntR family transcriptional regulator [Actinocorallia sp. API 0066]|uniref:GntR family transcriptional regulator n=1 Tax=Actinocorallia sp. API 0066 TaxID=2896846 RepID=UPI001E5CD221|nr:GntR family transcriptional regulator [Actinocorallia sp. API 0066]MCD0452538.1 GntR family transcriptional regulator [Actinocorallia sp. API 0066]
MSPRIERTDPPYLQVVRALRKKIESGELADGDMLPSVRQISTDWSISHATATKVLAALRAEGLAEGRPGVGTVVTSARFARSAEDRLVAIRDTGRIYPANEKARIDAAELVPAPARIADALGLEEGAPVIRRRRVTLRDDVPVSASTSWFDGALAEAAPLLLVAARIVQGTPGYIAETTGRRVVAGRNSYAADTADAQDATDLGIEPGHPVQRRRNLCFDADGDVVEFGESVATAGRWASYEYKIN